MPRLPPRPHPLDIDRCIYKLAPLPRPQYIFDRHLIGCKCSSVGQQVHTKSLQWDHKKKYKCPTHGRDSFQNKKQKDGQYLLKCCIEGFIDLLSTQLFPWRSSIMLFAIICFSDLSFFLTSKTNINLLECWWGTNLFPLHRLTFRKRIWIYVAGQIKP